MKRQMMKLFSMTLVALLMLLLGACIAPVQPESDAASGEQAAPITVAADRAEQRSTVDLGDELGDVDFPVSCSAEAQAVFDQGMAMLHSFEYGSAIGTFNHVLELDATCAMAYWGIAMSLVEPLWGQPTEQMLSDGGAAVEQAQALGGQTPREQAYIDAIAAFYTDSDTVDHQTRAVAYEEAMAQLVEDFPDDTEAKIFYALSLLATASPTDKTYANQNQAVAILEPLFAEQPTHPGVAHYLIHSNDYPALAADGLEAALRYSEIAPTAPHVQHMPSHIFTRLGYWQDSIDSNLIGAAASKARLPESDDEILSSDGTLHAYDYMMYGYLQLAQDEAAKALLDEVLAIERVTTDTFGAAYALSAIPGRYVLERGQWAEAASLTLSPSTFAWDLFPQAQAAIVFARGMGAARSGDVDAARQELERLEALHEEVAANGPAYWAGVVEIQHREVEAWLALAEGRNDEALALMQEAVALESATEKHPVSPGWIAPARELLGEMLLELDQPAEALAAFEAGLGNEPNRFRTLYGAAHAAELAGEMETAQAHYSTLMELGAHADSERAELAAAAAFLAE